MDRLKNLKYLNNVEEKLHETTATTRAIATLMNDNIEGIEKLDPCDLLVLFRIITKGLDDATEILDEVRSSIIKEEY